jgi:signal transduction histidine kinase
VRRPSPRRIGGELLAVGLPLVVVLLGVPPFAWSVAAGVLACAVLPLRHRSPVLALVGVLAGLAGGLGWAPALVALYALGRRARTFLGAAPWLALPLVAAVGPVFATQDLPWHEGALTVAYVVSNLTAPVVVGLLVGTRARLQRSLAELDRARESALAARSDAARAEERARIGREIHDAVGHHVTLIAVGAAALAASTREDHTRAAAEQLRRLAGRSLAEVRTALGLAAGAPSVPAPAEQAGADGIARLVADWRAAGLAVELADDGRAADVRPAVGRAAYRVVQEALTNAARHAPGATVRVEVAGEDDALRVRVVNTSATGPVRGADGGGTGLVGLRERVVAAGGRLRTGPRADGGFTVDARFPLEPVPGGTAESRPRGATSDGGAPALRAAG